MGIHQTAHLGVLFSYRKTHSKPVGLALWLVYRNYRQINHNAKVGVLLRLEIRGWRLVDFLT